MKTKVIVTLRREEEVEIEVEHEEDEDPTDLTKEDRNHARSKAGVDGHWDIINVTRA